MTNWLNLPDDKTEEEMKVGKGLSMAMCEEQAEMVFQNALEVIQGCQTLEILEAMFDRMYKRRRSYDGKWELIEEAYNKREEEL